MVLYDTGVLVNVPSPARYAVHKLIVAQRRREGAAKVDKDLRQAEALIGARVARRPRDLWDAWEEAQGRGPKWRELMTTGLSMIAPTMRDNARHVFGATRSILPGHDLRFTDAPPRYNFSDDTVMFEAQAGGERVFCQISREALDDHFDAGGLTKEGRLDPFRKHRGEVEGMGADYLPQQASSLRPCGSYQNSSCGGTPSAVEASASAPEIEQALKRFRLGARSVPVLTAQLSVVGHA